ncbi:hypothetical protein DL766_004349 [Monosporascus sp. MC13-8B]|uniref:Uncharacterized protein n=1 Tax=Monosporascus cannonballus TaxID=155416 RepID=A0ABY0H6J9_9PEZI|nr:hypothetical protein DL762_004843 [Monosporascus cannonballus]RYO93015.1 hypothetical protein DL763_004515 [Monosporascus cannonballus]RYP31479.1 hypothetical protein DL766_004349 [Monosporascus sp. MC13-8B]
MVNIPEGPDYEPTDAVPVVTPQMKMLLRRLDRGCLYDLALGMKEIAEANRDMSCIRHVAKDEDTWLDATRPLHGAPKKLHRAVILHTVAMQSRLPPGDPGRIALDIYHGDGPGTYVPTITVSRRNGMWLTGMELRELVDLVERYLAAERSGGRLSDGAVPTMQRAKQLARFAAEIDSVYGRAQYPWTAMIRRPRTRGKVESLVAGLKDLGRAAKDDIPIASPPCYVGCSRQATRARADNHKPHAGWHPKKGNQAWWLVMSCMKFMGLDPDVIVVPYLRTWEPGQLPASETMGMILADSFVERHGYNIWVPGSVLDLRDRDWERDQRAALEGRPWLIDQMEESAAMVAERVKLVKYLESLNVWDIHETLRQRIAQMQDDSDRAAAEFKRLEAAIELDRRTVADNLRAWRRQYETTMTISTLVDRIRRALLDDVLDETGAVGDEGEGEKDEQDGD